jgi:hypothetical protein
MKIIEIESAPVDYIPHMTAARGGGARLNSLAVQLGRVDALPMELEGLLVCSDLQGRELGGEGRLLGELVAERVERLAGRAGLPPAERIGVLLAGDLYARPEPERRGGLGDVTSVWLSFAERFRWVAGVLGNHDLLDLNLLRDLGIVVHLLDGNCVKLDHLTIGGVSGIIGAPERTNRKSAPEFCDLLLDVLEQKPDLVILHQGPALDDPAFRGSEDVTAVLECAKCLLVICGHVRWDEPLGQLTETVQVLNADSRVILLRGAAN